MVSQPARLSIKNRQLLLEQDPGQSATVPLEDISVLVLETPQAVITTALLSELAAHAVAVITCDATHHPNGLLLPYSPHSRSLRVAQRQLALTQPQCKRAWQAIVRQKLRNQAACLEIFEPGAGRWLRDQAERVGSGDLDNREGSGARYYFAALFGRDFTREQLSWRNAALNYGYAIVRAAIARSLVCHGFLPAFGLHHRSQLNAFNLADDLIEPLRPLVDDWVRSRNTPEVAELRPADKAGLVQRLYSDVALPDGRMNVLAAIEQMVEGLGRYCELPKVDALALPDCPLSD